MVVKVYNTKTLHKKIVINGISYLINKDGSYSLPLFTEPVDVKLIDFNNKVLLFKAANFSNEKDITTETQFPLDTTEDVCHFLPNSLVFDKSLNTHSSSPVNRYFVWTPYLNVSGISKQFNVFNISSIDIPDDSKDAFLYFTYPSVSKMSDLFVELSIRLEFENNNFEINDPRLSILDFNNEVKFKNPNICTEMPFKIQKGEKSGVVDISFSKNECQGFANVIGLFITTGNDTKLKVTTATFTRQTTSQNLKECEANTMQCVGMECTPQGGNFEVGCEPNCGKCIDGKSCNTEGMCEVNERKNTRSSCGAIFALMGLVLCFIF
ncbi:hypothetical protein EIN_033380 [Entamoeba invadens IP1]|uniref:Uncharacterized protein n=1 Tax=Entamoeba invadens IP1 TaxID=370355 RepID=A0A0A1TY82_ENTIV|nr:hypothetical protein EIN_033380 [Entamoeba invadens IP1]ELP86477.1 hypothetical protein EIN_033380 [Entamoeba invadens IP1]|eukprot:XP_004185823.1 hypothetical protein EIN_033380 [Entamoeba invadens IP1]